MRTATILWSVLLALALGFSDSASAEESVTGSIKEVKAKGVPITGATKDVVANVLLPGLSVHITKETLIVFSDAREGRGLADLKVGQRVSVRLASDIGCTDPPQVQTDLIVIHVPDKPGAKGK